MAAIAKTALPQLYSLRTLSEAGYGSIATLRRAIREGRLDAVRGGGRLKVTAEALARYIGEPISTGGEARGALKEIAPAPLRAPRQLLFVKVSLLQTLP